VPAANGFREDCSSAIEKEFPPELAGEARLRFRGPQSPVLQLYSPVLVQLHSGVAWALESERSISSYCKDFLGERRAAVGGIEGNAFDFSEAIWLLRGGKVYEIREKRQEKQKTVKTHSYSFWEILSLKLFPDSSTVRC